MEPPEPPEPPEPLGLVLCSAGAAGLFWGLQKHLTHAWEVAPLGCGTPRMWHPRHVTPPECDTRSPRAASWQRPGEGPPSSAPPRHVLELVQRGTGTSRAGNAPVQPQLPPPRTPPDSRGAPPLPVEVWEGIGVTLGCDTRQEPPHPLLLSGDPPIPSPDPPILPRAGSLQCHLPVPVAFPVHSVFNHGPGGRHPLPGDPRTRNTDGFGAQRKRFYFNATKWKQVTKVW